MRLDDHLAWHSCFPLQAVDILGEQLEEQALVIQQLGKGMGDRRAVATGVKLMRESVERQRVIAEVGYVEDSFGER